MTVTGIRRPAQALSLVRRERVVTLTPVGALPSLTFAVTGEAIRGSWWAHPLGKIIFNLASALDDADDIAVVKLVRGKVTFVHRSLWAPMLRVVTDHAFRTKAKRALSTDAATLLDRVERLGELRLHAIAAKDRKAVSKARASLEERLLVQSEQEHTQSGAHQTRLRSWSRWASPGLRSEASALAFDDASRSLRDACRGEAFLSPSVDRQTT